MDPKQINALIEHYAWVILGVVLAVAVVVPWWIGFGVILGMIVQ